MVGYVFKGIMVPCCVHRSVLACNKSGIAQARPKQRNELSIPGNGAVCVTVSQDYLSVLSSTGTQ